METLERAIIQQPFPGNAQTWIDANGKIAYHEDETIDEYLRANPNMKIITWEEYDKLHNDFFRSPLTEISEERWYEMLEVLPPLRWHDVNERFNVFYNCEAMSGAINGIYVKDRDTKKFFSGYMSRFASDAEILAEIEKDILKS